MPFACVCSMEAFSALRCVARRSIICFLFISMTFIACAFYTFFTDSKNPSSLPPFKLLDTNDFQEEIRSNPSGVVEHIDSRLSEREILNTELPPVLEVLKSASQPNISSHFKIKNAKSVQADTKYVYLSNATSASSTSTASSITTNDPSIDTCSLTMTQPKRILLWTSFFDHWNYLPKERFNQCSRCRNCEVTFDKSKLLESDAVIFHARDMYITEMPPLRLPHQRWVFYCLESPPYSDFPGLVHTRNMFNWTMTYRADSDIPSPYGYVTKVSIRYCLFLLYAIQLM